MYGEEENFEKSDESVNYSGTFDKETSAVFVFRSVARTRRKKTW